MRWIHPTACHGRGNIRSDFIPVWWARLGVQGDPRKCGGGGNGAARGLCLGWVCQRSREMMRDVWLVLRVRSFQIIVLQVSSLSSWPHLFVSTCSLVHCARPSCRERAFWMSLARPAACACSCQALAGCTQKR